VGELQSPQDPTFPVPSGSQKSLKVKELFKFKVKVCPGRKYKL